MAKDRSKSQKKEKNQGPREAITKDSRFASVHNDPRFRLPNLKNVKVKIDDRFSKKELDKLNSTATGRKVKVDRYGRALKDTDNTKDFDKYFEEEKSEESEDESEESDESEKSEDAEESEEESSDENEQATKAAPKKLKDKKQEGIIEETQSLDRARGEGLGSSSDEDSDDSSSSDSDSSEDEFEEDSEIELEESKPEEGDPSHSFAVVNMDWDNLRAVDLMATFSSFIPTGGSIKSVTIFPSEYGKEQMQREEIEGPPKELFKSKKKKEDESSDDDDDEIDLRNADDLEKAARKLYEEDDGEEDYDSKALRRYQLQRLRYFYAVIRCDSVKTAKNIYDNCDGTEYESTANIFDLRYIPDGMEFDDSEAKDVCTKIPSSYRPNSTFVTDALQHSKVKLTWDETPKERLTLSSRQFSQKEIDEMDFKAYLASDSDGSDDESKKDNESLKDKYKNLLTGGFSFDGKKDNDDEGDVDMEITFNPGLDDSKAEPKEDEEASKEESTIDAYRRKEKERRQRRLDKYKESQEPEDTPQVEDKKKNKNNKNKKNKDTELDARRKAELELVMMDENEEKDDSKGDHFNMRDIIKAEKAKGKKNRKNKKNMDESLTQDKFEADLNDPRFNEIFENHDFAIDKTSSEFKKTQTMDKIMKERSKRHRYDGVDSKANKKHKKTKEDTPGDSVDLQTLVSKLKRKNNK
ncbi:hypothetical protein HYPBUDRAFT_103358 [Hyphopichia burtonii NRRL Y-1933]|uniref:Uncharacterized protein n=1 Tax=Hyphopichia burtonii NRRL Y-1933 TaxID=984485 RepID=A0A1E4RS63_9ASCO|nr:hypothetical protein HYPBUDRAFT_103358 [Hyphopichia burtonii NRRL Y-1933]ODV70088.1 hypothetical protein HYPBUDRAFT_103358 [Hyphopichia burtonii NRRL Y-1933]